MIGRQNVLLRRILTLVTIVLVSGCASHRPADYSPPIRAVPLILPSGPVVSQTLVPDISPLRRWERDAGESITPYSVLSEDEVQCLAARQATTANLLLDESVAVHCGTSGKQAESATLLSDLLVLYSVHERNEAAATALETLLRLGEAEGGILKLEDSLKELEQMRIDVDRVQQQGLASPVSRQQIDERRYEMLRRRHETTTTTLQLNRTLGQLLNTSQHLLPQVWPDLNLQVIPESVDVDSAVMTALSTRVDLAAMRQAVHMTCEENLPAIRQVLGTMHGGLGNSLGSSGLIGRLRGSLSDETGVRADQLIRQLHSEEQRVALDVRLAVATVEQRLFQIRQTDDRLQALRGLLQELEQRRRVGQATPFEIREARLNAVSVEQDLLHDVIEWKVAVTRLKAAQGLLAVECGYSCETPYGGFSECHQPLSIAGRTAP